MKKDYEIGKYVEIGYDLGKLVQEKNANYGNSYAYVGSRLCFKTKAAAEHVAKHFEELLLANYLKLK